MPQITIPSHLRQIAKVVKSVVSKQRFAKDVKSVSVFGSYAKGLKNEKSDIDLLVEFIETPDLIEFSGLHLDLEDAFEKEVDLLTTKSIHPLLEESILSSTIKIFEK